MGTHISRVKSIDLDMWTPEQMEVCISQFQPIPSLTPSESIQKWGNRRANLYWEAHLKAGHVPPDQYVLFFETNPFLTPPPVLQVKWNPLFARNTNRGGGPRTVLPPRIHPSSRAPHGPFPTGTQAPLRMRRSLTHLPPALRLRVSPHPAPPRPLFTPPPHSAKTPPTRTPNPDNYSPLPSWGASKHPPHRPGPSPSPNHHHHRSSSSSSSSSNNNNQRQTTTSFRLTSMHPPRNRPHHPNPPQKTLNKTFSPSSPRHLPPRQLHQPNPSSPRMRSVSLRRHSRGTHSGAFLSFRRRRRRSRSA